MSVTGSTSSRVRTATSTFKTEDSSILNVDHSVRPREGYLILNSLLLRSAKEDSLLLRAAKENSLLLRSAKVTRQAAWEVA